MMSYNSSSQPAVNATSNAAHSLDETALIPANTIIALAASIPVVVIIGGLIAVIMWILWVSHVTLFLMIIGLIIFYIHSLKSSAHTNGKI